MIRCLTDFSKTGPSACVRDWLLLMPAFFAVQILPVAVRGKAMSIVIFVNRLMSGIIASSFQTLEEKISKSWAFYFFAVLSAVSIFFYLKVRAPAFVLHRCGSRSRVGHGCPIIAFNSTLLR